MLSFALSRTKVIMQWCNLGCCSLMTNERYYFCLRDFFEWDDLGAIEGNAYCTSMDIREEMRYYFSPRWLSWTFNVAVFARFEHHPLAKRTKILVDSWIKKVLLTFSILLTCSSGMPLRFIGTNLCCISPTTQRAVLNFQGARVWGRAWNWQD